MNLIAADCKSAHTYLQVSEAVEEIIVRAIAERESLVGEAALEELRRKYRWVLHVRVMRRATLAFLSIMACRPGKLSGWGKFLQVP